MDPIKEAFRKIKEEFKIIREEISVLHERMIVLEESNYKYNPTHNPTQIITQTDNPTHNPTVPQEMKGFQVSKSNSSTGNEGVPTDNPTNTQTIQQTGILDRFTNKSDNNLSIDNIQGALDSLDNIKKEIRIKFKKLTPQEMLVFSTLYTLESKEVEEITYKVLSNNLGLSESSIRDYIIKLTQKGIPIEKRRINNKQIALQISPNLKKIASLSTIIKLRDI